MRFFTIIISKLLNVAQGLGEMLSLLCETVYYFKEAPRNLNSIFRQMNLIGVGTLPIAAAQSARLLELTMFFGLFLPEYLAKMNPVLNSGRFMARAASRVFTGKSFSSGRSFSRNP